MNPITTAMLAQWITIGISSLGILLAILISVAVLSERRAKRPPRSVADPAEPAAAPSQPPSTRARAAGGPRKSAEPKAAPRKARGSKAASAGKPS